jgi:16S rRNA (guanine966-N2)-methyltransferase
LTDRIRQSLFDALGQRCDGWRVVDVCAGSGSFGLEAASRGAERIDFIEAGASAADTLAANIATCGGGDRCHLHCSSFQAVLAHLGPADCMYADPPFPWYADEPALIAAILELGARALADEGQLLIRGETGYDLPDLPATLRETRRSAYGRSWVAWLERVPG